MTTTIRVAIAADLDALHTFGEHHVREHYSPLIGPDAAEDQVRTWWSTSALDAPVARADVLVAETDGVVSGVGQLGRYGDDHVIWKLYLDPARRGQGLGPRLIAALLARLPAGTDRVWIEHFAGNARAGSFYEREGFVVDRIEPSSSGDPALAQVWRVRTLRSRPGAR